MFLWKKRFEQDGDGLPVPSVVGELKNSCVIVEVQNAASPVLRRETFIAVDDRGEDVPISKQLSDAFQDDHIFVSDGKIFAQNMQDTKHVSLWEMKDDRLEEIWSRLIPEIDGLWGNQTLWTESA